MNRHIRIVFAICLLPLVFWLYFNRMANWHFHQLPNGIIVEHAHPYAKSTESQGSPFASHQHTDFEYYYLDMLFRVVFALILTAFALLLLRAMLIRQPECYSFIASPSFILGNSSPRAPPCQ